MAETLDSAQDVADSARTVGLTRAGRDRLRRLKEDGHFAEMIDAYRFAVAMALANGANPSAPEGERVTMFNVGTLDPEGLFAAGVVALCDLEGESPYRAMERLAEWGSLELERLVDEHGTGPVADLAEQARQVTEGASRRSG